MDQLRRRRTVIVITWLHDDRRDVLKNHPRSDETHPLTGVFYTRRDKQDPGEEVSVDAG